MTVVSDTSVLCHLVLIDCIDILPRRFGSVAIPAPVAEECLPRGAPDGLSAFIRTPPGRRHILPAPSEPIPQLAVLDAGECAAIRLAPARAADLLLIDERQGRTLAQSLGLTVAGTLGANQRKSGTDNHFYRGNRCLSPFSPLIYSSDSAVSNS